MFYDLFYDLCTQKGVSPSRACLDMGLSRSLAAKWKNTGATPSADVISKIADYFNVSADTLLGKNGKPATQKGSGRGPKYEELMYALEGLSEEEQTEVLKFARTYADGLRLADGRKPK